MKFEKIFNDFKSKKILIIGDVMIDSYVWGVINRQSPEAPVPIVNIKKKEERLGGAGNVALNINALGGEAILCSVIGDDYTGKKLIELMQKEKLATDGIVIDKKRKTTNKTRIINNQKHVLRIDEEETTDIANENTFLNIVFSFIEDADAIILQDYNKGVLTKKIIKNIIEEANNLNIATIVDPKKRNFKTYKNCTIFKPNLKETQEGMKTNINPENMQNIKDLAKDVRLFMNSKAVLITLSEKGVCIDSNNFFLHTPAFKRNIIDISGAGDTVLAVASMCKAINMQNDILSILCNIAGGLVCEEVGVTSINKENLYNEAKKHINENS